MNLESFLALRHRSVTEPSAGQVLSVCLGRGAPAIFCAEIDFVDYVVTLGQYTGITERARMYLLTGVREQIGDSNHCVLLNDLWLSQSYEFTVSAVEKPQWWHNHVEDPAAIKRLYESPSNPTA